MTKAADDGEGLLDLQQAAAFLNIAPRTLRLWVSQGRVRAIRFRHKAPNARSRVRFRRATLEQFIDAHADPVPRRRKAS